MKIFTFLILALVGVGSISSCSKKDEASAEDVAKANEFKAFVGAKKFQISEYYADKAIDYVEDDSEVRTETDLWRYVSLWIKDDFNVFDVSTGTVTITQNEDKIEGNSSATITKPIAIYAKKDGVYFDFLNYQYNPLKYHLVEFTSDHFLVYANWTGGAKVYTKFVVVP